MADIPVYMVVNLVVTDADTYRIYEKGFFPLSEMPSDLELEVGDELELTNENGEPILAVVADLSGDSVTLDGNPPLAGETLIFDLELVSIN